MEKPWTSLFILDLSFLFAMVTISLSSLRGGFKKLASYSYSVASRKLRAALVNSLAKFSVLMMYEVGLYWQKRWLLMLRGMIFVSTSSLALIYILFWLVTKGLSCETVLRKCGLIYNLTGFIFSTGLRTKFYLILILNGWEWALFLYFYLGTPL